MSYYFIGIGGAGMSVVAELLLAEGETISGSDARASDVTKYLAGLGVTVFIGQDSANVPDDAIVVISSAIRESNPELAISRMRGQQILHRSQALALAANGRDFVAVAGAHGKTTTSAMLATAIRTMGGDPSWAIGGHVTGVGAGGHLGRTLQYRLRCNGCSPDFCFIHNKTGQKIAVYLWCNLLYVGNYLCNFLCLYLLL